METTEQIIRKIEELPPGERQKIAEYLKTVEDEMIETFYPPEVMEEIDRDIEEAKQGINASPVLKDEEANDYLKNLMNQKNT